MEEPLPSVTQQPLHTGNALVVGTLLLIMATFMLNAGRHIYGVFCLLAGAWLIARGVWRRFERHP